MKIYRIFTFLKMAITTRNTTIACILQCPAFGRALLIGFN